MIKRIISERRRKELREEAKIRELKKLVEKELWDFAIEKLKKKGLNPLDKS